MYKCLNEGWHITEVEREIANNIPLIVIYKKLIW